jgi:polyisoprenoid-binding protein YceI
MFGLGTVHAEFTVNSGELQVSDPPSASTVTVSVNAASFTSGNAKRDKDVAAAGLLDVANYPDITFASTGMHEESDHWLLSGSMTAHGTAAPVDITIDRVTPEADGIRVHGQVLHLDRHAFGVTKGKGMVGRYLDLDLDMFASLV